MRFILLAVFLAVLLVSGGASRAEVPAQVLVRCAAWGLLIVGILFADPGSAADRRAARPVVLLVGGAVVLALLQLVPLPPALWQALPGRALLAEAAEASGQHQPWRPWSMVPGATFNAASALIVPVVTLVLAMGLTARERWHLPGLLLGLAIISTLVGLLQFSGTGFDNPLVNDTPGQVSGFFANRNHFALFTAMGCVLAPVWAFREGRARWRGPAALLLIPLFVLAILASGSRAGMIVGVLAIGIGLLLVRQPLGAELDSYPRWVFPALVAGMLGVMAIFVLLSVAAGRAVSIDRALAIDPGQDMRTRGLPTVLAMIHQYFPWGSGLGGFDPVFRMHEPFALLKLTSFNNAHNDYLEIVLQAGLPGLALLTAGLIWWGWASARAWRARSGTQAMPARLGSALLLLLLIASAFDYPARTPLIMAVAVLGGLWLCRPLPRDGASALPKTDQHL